MQTEPMVAAVRPTIILASGSPRRSELIGRLGWDFTVIVPDVDEDIEALPRDMVEILSKRKATAVAAQLNEGIILAADTIVALGDKVLGKPADEANAKAMLSELSGRSHEVFTGVCMIDAKTGATSTRVDRTVVHFKTLSESQIDDYVATGEPMDKAGAYGAQGIGGQFVKSIEGSFTNVMGLPIEVLEDMLLALRQ